MKPSEYRKMKLNWGYVFRASAKEKLEMSNCVQANNESDFWLDNEEDKPIFTLEKSKTGGYVCMATYPSGNTESGHFIRCGECGEIWDMWEGQGNRCFCCESEWIGF